MTMPEYRFETHQPVDLYVEFGKGHATIQFTDTTETTVRVEGNGADEVMVEQSGNAIRVVEPRRSGFLRDHALRVDVTVPSDSNPTVRTGSADIELAGRAGTGQLRSGSGDVRVEEAGSDLLVETGSGDISVGRTQGSLRSKSGSGDIQVGEVDGQVSISTGSGDVSIDVSRGAASVKTGSGDMRFGDAYGDVQGSTGSGDFTLDRVHQGKVTAKGASGDVKVGVPAGVPIWTDLTTVTGAIRSSLQGAGEPTEGQPHVELRAKTVSGDIVLTEV
jgi:Putative adhesin